MAFAAFLLGGSEGAKAGAAIGQDKPGRRRPNIVYILADDLGYGDVGCYNPATKIPTPYLDRLATSGIRFADAHAPTSVCTPTRYAISWATRNTVSSE